MGKLPTPLDHLSTVILFTHGALGATVRTRAMGILEPIDRRHEPRTQLEIDVIIWGVDTRGERFVQRVLARNISLSGALICGIESELRSGDVIGVLYRGKTSRYRVVWIRYQDGVETLDAAIHRIEPDLCPWQEMILQRSKEESVQEVRFPSDWH